MAQNQAQHLRVVEGDVTTAPPLPCKLYRHWDAADRLLYVGISLNAVARLSQHRDASAWYDDIARVTIETFYSRDDALKAEALAIQAENPIHNRYRPRGAKPETSAKSRADETRREMNTKVALRPFYDIRAVADLLGVGSGTVRNEIGAGRLHSILLDAPNGGKQKVVRISGWHLLDYIDRFAK